ncbi:uncharacterized protein E5676_scaffold121G00700 [Cucumis melo var. makuwa]|uniref:Uncharacterized protein n=1 Tax=Cucumis melo var. makuwa TaxID=1194695 RepID=A0A5D3BXA8_CUCMM|nr:uncharacterized protein E6C27_scaffold269G001560 [Cucumis melo var. makuwa]TYK03462.1 uncharacterized protein E5676_scaffold121G00700 [Cucumis melo var. makuwa]
MEEGRLEDEMPRNIGCRWYDMDANKKVDDVENEHLNILEIVVSHRVDEHIEDVTLCRTNVDPTIIERPVVLHVTNDFIDDVDGHLSHANGTSDDDE